MGTGALERRLRAGEFAITAEISEDIPGQYVTGGAQNPVMLNWGFTLQYSLPYYNANVATTNSGAANLLTQAY